jgi:hypothetical protein
MSTYACNENGEIDGEPPVGIAPVGLSQLFINNPCLRPIVIEGILRRGETMNIIAAAKVGKSFLALYLAICIANGAYWLSHLCKQGRVLIIDNELHPETLASRIKHIADKMGIGSDYEQYIDIVNLRGRNVDIHQIEMQLAAIAPGYYTLVLLDALYRATPDGTSENDNAAMMRIYNKLDHYASKWDCAIGVIHHSSKGDQSNKSVTDVGSGAGSISRAADTHLVIRPHEQPDLAILEAVTRSFKSPDAVSIRFEWPLWEAVTTAPAIKKPGQSSEEKRAKDDKEADELLDKTISSNAPKFLSESQLVRSTGMGPTRVSRAIGRAMTKETIRAKKVKRSGRRITTYGKTATPTATVENIAS